MRVGMPGLWSWHLRYAFGARLMSHLLAARSIGAGNGMPDADKPRAGRARRAVLAQTGRGARGEGYPNLWQLGTMATRGVLRPGLRVVASVHDVPSIVRVRFASVTIRHPLLIRVVVWANTHRAGGSDGRYGTRAGLTPLGRPGQSAGDGEEGGGTIGRAPVAVRWVDSGIGCQGGWPDGRDGQGARRDDRGELRNTRCVR